MAVCHPCLKFITIADSSGEEGISVSTVCRWRLIKSVGPSKPQNGTVANVYQTMLEFEQHDEALVIPSRCQGNPGSQAW